MENGKRRRYYWVPYRVEFHKMGKNIHYELWINNRRKKVGRILAKTDIGHDEEETEAAWIQREEEIEAMITECGEDSVTSLVSRMSI